MPYYRAIMAYWSEKLQYSHSGHLHTVNADGLYMFTISRQYLHYMAINIGWYLVLHLLNSKISTNIWWNKYQNYQNMNKYFTNIQLLIPNPSHHSMLPSGTAPVCWTCVGLWEAWLRSWRSLPGGDIPPVNRTPGGNQLPCITRGCITRGLIGKIPKFLARDATDFFWIKKTKMKQKDV